MGNMGRAEGRLNKSRHCDETTGCDRTQDEQGGRHLVPEEELHRAFPLEHSTTAIHDTTFVIVDLETTGEDHATSAITEIGAVKIRNGQVIAEMTTMVNPHQTIPAEIVTLTGITDDMVATAQPISTILPTFLHFAKDTVLVAHNADFDLGFLTTAAHNNHIAWPNQPAICTVRLGRRLLSQDEAPTMALAALTKTLGLTSVPTHRALDDARTTAELLNTLTARATAIGLTTPADLYRYYTTDTAVEPTAPDSDANAADRTWNTVRQQPEHAARNKEEARRWSFSSNPNCDTHLRSLR